MTLTAKNDLPPATWTDEQRDQLSKLVDALIEVWRMRIGQLADERSKSISSEDLSQLSVALVTPDSLEQRSKERDCIVYLGNKLGWQSGIRCRKDKLHTLAMFQKYVLRERGIFLYHKLDDVYASKARGLWRKEVSGALTAAGFLEDDCSQIANFKIALSGMKYGMRIKGCTDVDAYLESARVLGRRLSGPQKAESPKTSSAEKSDPPPKPQLAPCPLDLRKS